MFLGFLYVTIGIVTSAIVENIASGPQRQSKSLFHHEDYNTQARTPLCEKINNSRGDLNSIECVMTIE